MSAISQNYFELFNLPQRFSIEENTLETAYHAIQSKIHPDRFTHASEVEKRLSLQWATYTNQAYKTLQSPLQRALYLLRLHDLKINSASSEIANKASNEFTNESIKETTKDFLFHQITLRETLEEATTAQDFKTLLHTIQQEEIAPRYQRLAEQLDNLNPNYPEASTVVNELLFLEKFERAVLDKQEQLEH